MAVGNAHTHTHTYKRICKPLDCDLPGGGFSSPAAAEQKHNMHQCALEHVQTMIVRTFVMAIAGIVVIPS